MKNVTMLAIAAAAMAMSLAACGDKKETGVYPAPTPATPATSNPRADGGPTPQQP